MFLQYTLIIFLLTYYHTHTQLILCSFLLSPKYKTKMKINNMLKRKPIKTIFYGSTHIGIWPSLMCGWYTLWYSSEENWFSLSNASITKKASCIGLGPPLNLGKQSVLYRSWDAIIGSLNFYLHYSCCIWNLLIPWCHPQLLMFQICFIPLMHRPRNLRVRGLMKTCHLELRTPKFSELCTLSSFKYLW